MSPIAASIEETTIQEGMRETARILFEAPPEVREKVAPQVRLCLKIGADAIDRLEQELAYERQINEALRGIKDKPIYRPNYWLRTAAVVGVIWMFWAVWPVLQYVFNP